MTKHRNNPSLKDLLAGAQLPALPQSAIRLMELSQDPENGPAEFAVPIEADAGLTGQVLRFVNSSYFGFSREISSVKLAITLVGVRTIKNFALWSAVFSLMPNPRCGPFDIKNLWKDSLRRGLFARAMGKRLGLKDSEDLFAAALLQDMAIPLLAKELPDEYQRLLEARQRGPHRLSTLERERFGWTHAEAARHIADSWSLPETFGQLILAHCDLDRVLADAEAGPGRVAVCLSALLPSTCDDHWDECERFDAVFQQLQGAGSSAAEMLAEIDQGFAEFAPVLKLSSQGKSLVESYHEATAVETA